MHFLEAEYRYTKALGALCYTVWLAWAMICILDNVCFEVLVAYILDNVRFEILVAYILDNVCFEVFIEEDGFLLLFPAAELLYFCLYLLKTSNSK